MFRVAAAAPTLAEGTVVLVAGVTREHWFGTPLATSSIAARIWPVNGRRMGRPWLSTPWWLTLADTLPAHTGDGGLAVGEVTIMWRPLSFATRTIRQYAITLMLSWLTV